MTIPRIFSSSFYFNVDLGVVACANIITSLETILLAQTPVWTKLGTGVYKSPVDSAGRFMVLTMTAPTTARLNMLLSDQNGITVCQRELSIDTTLGSTINYFTGQFYVWIESLKPTPEQLGAVMVDPYPYGYDVLKNYVMGSGFRPNGGATDGLCSQFDTWFMLESGVSQVRQRCRDWALVSDAQVSGMLDFTGNPQVFPFDVNSIPNGSRAWMGQIPQMYVSTQNFNPQTLKPIAIDDATAATFKVIAGVANTSLQRGMWRVA
jgi:hypothetical protein